MAAEYYSSPINGDTSPRGQSILDALELYPDSPLSPLRPPNRPFQYDSTRSSFNSLSSSNQSDTLTPPSNRGTWRSDVSGSSTATYVDAFAFRAYETTSAPQVIITEPTTPARVMSAGWSSEEASNLDQVGGAGGAMGAEHPRKPQLATDDAMDGQMTPSSSAGRTKSLFKTSNFSRPLRAPARADSTSSDARSSYERSESVLSTYSTSSSIPSFSDSKVHTPLSVSSPYSETSFHPQEAERQRLSSSPVPDDRGPSSASSSPSFSTRPAPAVARRPTNPVRFRPPRTPPSAPPPPAPTSWPNHDVQAFPSVHQGEGVIHQAEGGVHPGLHYHHPPPQHQHLPPNPHPSPHPQQRRHPVGEEATVPERPMAGRSGSNPAQFPPSRGLQPEVTRGSTSRVGPSHNEIQRPSLATRTQIMEQMKGRAPPPPPLPTITTSDANRSSSANQDRYADQPPEMAPPFQEMTRLGAPNLSSMHVQERYSFYDPELLPRSPGGSSQGSRHNTPAASTSPLVPNQQFLNPTMNTTPQVNHQHPTTSPAPSPHHRSRDHAENEALKTEPRTAEDYLQLGITYHQKDKLVDSARCFEISAKGTGSLLRGHSPSVSSSTRSAGRPSGSPSVGRPSGGSSLSGDGEGGCAVGMLMWGLTLRSGWGVKPDEEKGFKWLRRAAELAVEDLEVTRTKLAGGGGGDGKLSGLQVRT